MNKGLEALEKIRYDLLEWNREVIPGKYDKEYNTIKQDLERLEHLEKENQELKDKLSNFEKPILYMCGSRESRNYARMRLIKLASMLNVPIILEDTETLNEKQKLKKAIEILKDKLCVRKGTLSFTRDSYYLGVKGTFKDIKELTEEEFELLKEVLE